MRIPKIQSKIIYHIYNRGVSKRKLFLNEADYKFFLYKLAFFKKKYVVKIISYCIMPNHYHLLIYTEEKSQKISKFVKAIQVSYAMYFNKHYDHAGHVFEGKYKHKEITDSYYLQNIIDYIANNPVRKKLVRKANNWPYSG